MFNYVFHHHSSKIWAASGSDASASTRNGLRGQMVRAEAKREPCAAAIKHRLHLQHRVGRLHADSERRVVLRAQHAPEPRSVRDERLLPGRGAQHLRLRFLADRRSDCL